MHAIGFISILLLVMISFILLCVVAFTGDEFSKRHLWREMSRQNKSAGWNKTVNANVNLGRLFILILFRAWIVLLIVSLLYLFGAKYVA
jgi:hypothetical protein